MADLRSFSYYAMLILGHLGCALAATQAGEAAYKRIPGRRFSAAVKLIDYRILAVGAMLPDIIDKPLAFILPGVLEGVTRNIGHTLLFSLLLVVIWRLDSGRKMNFLLPLAIGSALHLLLDGMFTIPSTLLWPFMGWEFVDRGYATDLFSALPIAPLPWNVHWLAFSEVLGGLLLAHTVHKVWRDNKGVHGRTPRSTTSLQTPVTPAN